MEKLPYDNFNSQEFIVRDWLALDRTVLANERTFLAYGRTSLGLFLGGMTLIKVFTTDFAIATGWVFVVASVGIFFYGVRRFLQMQGHYRSLAAMEETALPKELAKEFGPTIAEAQRDTGQGSL